ncbi:hypothetical protein BN128_3862 [Cronobacter sakazakii 696]|nr:hypothetical protein BN129_3993 [Cronobacter sakazakii 701]CCK09711.1 hypothetical protein BN128_3862 [Cronobacter sakazakii 696]
MNFFPAPAAKHHRHFGILIVVIDFYETIAVQRNNTLLVH